MKPCKHATCGEACRRTKKTKKAYKIPKVSKKQRSVKKELSSMYSVFLAKDENLLCNIKSPVCSKISTCVNHTNGRGANVLNEKDWEPSCNPCNTYIEQHHAWAQERGHKKQRHRKTN